MIARFRRELAAPLARYGFTALALAGAVSGEYPIAAGAALLAVAGWAAHRSRRTRHRKASRR